MNININKRNGISLIVLVITIIIMIILAAAIILALTSNGIISNSRKAGFQSDIKAMQEELSVYIADKVSETEGQYKSENLNASKDRLEENGEVVEGKTIQDIITSLEDKYIDEIVIRSGNLEFIGEDLQELEWANEILYGIKSGSLSEANASGNSVILENSASIDLVDYKIYGNSVQESKNLFDGQFVVGSLDMTTGTTFEEQTASTTTDRIRMVNPIVLQKNTDYVIKSSLTNYLAFRLYGEDGLCTQAISVTMTSGEYTFNSGDNTSMAFAVVSQTDTNVEYEVYQVEPTPNAPIEIESVGDLVTEGEYAGKYKIPITVSKNIFKTVTFEQGTIYDATGALSNSETRVRTSLFSLEQGTYTVKTENTNKIFVRGLHIYNYETEVWEEYQVFSTYNKTFTLSKKSKVRLLFNTGSNDVITPDDLLAENPVLQLGETIEEPVTTNIYLNEPLRKVGNYADYIDFENQKVVRNIKSINANTDATNLISFNDGNGGIYPSMAYTLVDECISDINGMHCFCNRLISRTRQEVYDGNQGISVNGTRIRIYYVGLTDLTVAEFKAWAEENPIIVDYILATPTEETIELPNIPTHKGTIIIEVDTKIKPDKIETVYYTK